MQTGRAGQLQRHGEHVGAETEEQPLTEIENARISPCQCDGDAEHAIDKILGDTVQPEFVTEKGCCKDQRDEDDIGGDLEFSFDAHVSAP